MEANSILSLRGFGISYGDREILSEINIDIARVGVTVILGPSGTGKSSLLRTVSGANDGHPTLLVKGTTRYFGKEHRPPLVMQKAKLMISSVMENLVASWPLRSELTPQQQHEHISNWLTELDQSRFILKLRSPVIDLSTIDQRLVAILRVALLDAPLILVDEPTAGLNYEQSKPIIDLLRHLGRKRSVIVVMHHLEQSKSLAGTIILLASRRVQEVCTANKFFLNPSSAAGRQFLLTGSCPEEPQEDIADEHFINSNFEPNVNDLNFSHATYPNKPRYMGPNGFAWLVNGQLAGTPWPGLIRAVDYDLQLLKDIGVTRLFSLTDSPFDEHQASRFGIAVSHDSVIDMKPPGMSQALSICKRIYAAIQHGEVIAVHCKAGLGRTGTVLAAYWIWLNRGKLSGETALREIRIRHPGWVQSKSQIDFINMFALAVASLNKETEVSACESSTAEEDVA
jgi:atypical dual specificity phosphatase